MVLVCVDPSEAVTAFFCSRLNALSIDHLVLDLRAVGGAYSVEWSWRNGRPSGSILSADWRVSFDELTGVYFRNVLPDESDGAEENSQATCDTYPQTDPQIASVLNSLPCRVVNRPIATHSNYSKPYQALIIRRFDFRIPRTFITNDPEAALRFYSECEGKVISKSTSGVRSIVRLMNKEDLGRLPLLESCPTQLQEYLPGDDIRVHVIGERVYAVRIQCDAVDYRYAGQEGYARTMVPAKLPEDVKNKCIRLTKEFGLAMSGIDLRETPAGEYYCFEVNTSPAFPFYESPGRPVVADALAEFLAQREASR
jgi:glutathione synthase/RimK-type ligase-like ATP-grasp enzyme